MIQGKVSQIGRSVLEMIAVIVLIGLLIVGGLYGMQTMRAGSEVQGIDKQINALVVQRRVNMPQVMNQPAQRKEVGPYGVEFTVENGTKENNPESFWVTVKVASGTLCDKLVNENSFLLEEPQKVENGCPEQVKFFFLKYAEQEKPVMVDGVCPDHGSCSDGHVSCETGYAYSKGYCVLCSEGEACMTCPEERPYADGQAHCVKCIKGVGCGKSQYCDNDNSCQTCPNGQYPNASRDSCSGCKAGQACPSCEVNTPIWNGTACVCNEKSCGSGSYCDEGSCKACSPTSDTTCLTPPEDEHGCPLKKKITCDEGKYCAPSGICITCPAGADCSNEGKILCKQGERLVGSGCVACESNTICESCKDSRYPLWDGEKCVCSDNSCGAKRQCLSNGRCCTEHGFCTDDQVRCDEGYTLKNSYCVACEEGQTCGGCSDKTPIWKGEKCICTTNSCGSNETCLPSGVCALSSDIKCEEGTHLVKGECKQCEPGTVCSTCKESTLPVWNGQKCVCSTDSCNGLLCLDTGVCCPEHAICDLKADSIECELGYNLTDGKCVACEVGGVCSSCTDSTLPKWNGTKCVCDESSCGSGKTCSSDGKCVSGCPTGTEPATSETAKGDATNKSGCYCPQAKPNWDGEKCVEEITPTACQQGYEYENIIHKCICIKSRIYIDANGEQQCCTKKCANDAGETLDPQTCSCIKDCEAPCCPTLLGSVACGSSNTGYQCCDIGAVCNDTTKRCCELGEKELSGVCCPSQSTGVAKDPLTQKKVCCSENVSYSYTDTTSTGTWNWTKASSTQYCCPKNTYYAATEGVCCKEGEDIVGGYCCPSGTETYVSGVGCCPKGTIDKAKDPLTFKYVCCSENVSYAYTDTTSTGTWDWKTSGSTQYCCPKNTYYASNEKACCKEGEVIAKGRCCHPDKLADDGTCAGENEDIVKESCNGKKIVCKKGTIHACGSDCCDPEYEYCNYVNGEYHCCKFENTICQGN